MKTKSPSTKDLPIKAKKTAAKVSPPSAKKPKPAKEVTTKTSKKSKPAKKASSKSLEVVVPPLPQGCAPSVGPVERKILASLAYLLGLGTKAPPRQMISGLCGYKNARSATYSEATKTLRNKGLIDYPTGDAMSLTDAGISACGSAAARPTTNGEAHTRIKNILSAKGVEIFDILTDGREHDRTGLALAVGYKNPRVSDEY